MKKLLQLLLLIPLSAALGQVYWDHMLHPERLTYPLEAELVHFSSWARNDGNSDLGWYYGNDPYGWRILCDIEGPGVITDMWWTKDGATDAWRWRLYIDNMSTALIDTPITYPFGDMEPFSPPIADSSSGGYYSYVPIPFQGRARITYNNAGSIYFHVSVLKFPQGTPISSFTMPPSPAYMVKLDSLRQRLESPSLPVFTPFQARVDCTAVLVPGTKISFSTEPFTGRTRRLLLRMQNRTQQVFENVWIRVFTDGYPLPDIEGPLSVAMGTPLGWRPYQSVVTGSVGDTLYFNLPIAADRGIRVELENRTSQAQPFSAAIETVVEDIGPFRLNGLYREGNPTRLWENFKLAEFSGAGNFVGTVMDMQQTDPHVFEGDEVFFVDGESTPSWHGTGTEDYFKGGRYWTPVYDQEELHGCVAYLGDTAAAYRWHNNDVIPFNTSLRYETEVGRFNNFQGHYRTMSFAYVERPEWKILDASGDGATHGGERLRIVGARRDPNVAVFGVFMGGAFLELAEGSILHVNSDSVFDATFLAPDTLPAGSYAVQYWTDDGYQTVNPEWRHLGGPTLWFRPVRTDIDNTVYAGDTLDVELHGLQQGETASIAIAGWPSPWLGSEPFANSVGTLTGRVRVQHGLYEGEYQVTATPIASLPAVCDSLLHYRYWFRVEAETIYKVSAAGTRLKEEWCRDWIRADNQDPWGRFAVHQLIGANSSSYVTFRFYAPAAGTFRAAYFFGKTSNAPFVSMEINGQPSLPATDMFAPTLYSSWIRSDTLWGGVHALNEGYNTVTMRTVGINPSSGGWRANLDQILFVADAPQPKPRTVEELTIQRLDTTIELSWRQVNEDVEGTPLAVEAYDVFRSLPGDSLWYWQAEVPGSETSWQFPFSHGEQYEFMVTARRDAGAPLTAIPKRKLHVKAD